MMMLGMAIATVTGQPARADDKRCGKRTPEPFIVIIIVIAVREKIRCVPVW